MLHLYRSASVVLFSGVFAAGVAPCALAQEAQDATVTIGTPELRGSFDSDPRGLSPADEIALRRALNVDAGTLDRRARPFGTDKGSPRANWTRDEAKDGAATVKVNRSLPMEWDTKVGADVGLAPATPNLVQTDRLLAPNTDAGSGAAWASIAVPNVAALDARVTPTQDQSAVGATFKQAVPIGQEYTVTLQNRFGVVDTYGSNSALTGVATPGRVYTTDREVKFNVLASQTALAAGTSSNTTDNVTRGRVSAEQKIYGPLSVSAGVSEIGAPVTNKTVKAGFKVGW